jgi:hypothetical protein
MPSGPLPSSYVKLTGTVGPDTYEQTFALTDPQFGLGGLRTVGTTAEMEAIYAERRQVGMIVYVSGLTAYYALIGTTANSGWTTGFTFGFVGGSGIGGDYVSTFNGRTGAVQGVSSAAAGAGIFLNAATGAITITNIGVQSFNGNTGNVQGVSSWNGQTGAVSFVDYVTSFNGVTGAVGGVTTSVANTFTVLQSFNSGISAAGATLSGTVTAPTPATGTNNTQVATTAFVQNEIVADTVTSFNGRTGAVQGVSAAVAGTGIFVSGATGSVTITNVGVQSFNGFTGAVQGVSSWNGQTGAVSFVNYVSSFNGKTGSVFGASLGANTFTELNTFNGGLVTTGLTVGAGLTVSGNMSVSGNLTVSGGVTFTISENVLIEDNIITLNSNVTGTPTENSGIEIERGTSPNVYLLWNESSDRWTFTNNGTQYYDIPTDYVGSFNGLTGSLQGVSAAVAGTGIFVSGATGSVTITNVGVQSFNGLTGAVQGVSSWNGQTGAVTFVDYVSGFNGRTGAVQGVSAAAAGTGIFLNAATGSVTITNTGVLSFNGNTGNVQGVSSWNGQTGAVTFTDYVTSFNGLTGAVTGVNSVRGLTGAVGITNGSGIGLSVSGQTMTFNNTGVLSINGGTGAITNVARTNVDNIFSASQTISTSNAVLSIVDSSSLNEVSFQGEFNRLYFYNDISSGEVYLQPTIASASTITVSLPNYSTTLAGLAGTQTFTGTNTFNTLTNFPGGISAAGATLNGNIISGNGIIRAASTSTGILLFDTSTGITIGNNSGGNSGTLSLRPNTITVGPSTGNSAYIRTNTGITLELRPRHNLVLAPTPNTPLTGTVSSITLPISSSETLFSGGIYSYFSYWDGDKTTYNPRLRLWSDETKAGAFYLDVSMDTPTANREIKFPNLSGTVALTNQVIGTVNGSTAATTAVTSFNGLTGAVQGVSAAVAGTGIFLNAATGSVTITNVGVQSFNGLTGAVQGVSSWNGQTGAVSFVNYVTSFNGVTGAVGGVTTSVANTFTVLQSFNSGISAAGATLSANTRIPAGATLTVDGNIVANGNVSLGNATSDTITSAADITVNSLTVGRGGGGVSTNTAVGVNALASNSTGSISTAIGNNALNANTTGSSNVAVGDGALNANTTGSFNTAFGRRALLVNNGSSNTAAGNGALSALSAGSFNTAIGRLTGTDVVTATGGIYIGYSNIGTDLSTNEIVIGTQAVGFGSNTAVIGAATQTAAYIYGLVNAMGGVSAAGATFSNINIRGTGRIQAGTSETLYLGAAGGTEIEVNNDESAIRLWANGTQAIECFDTSTSVYTDFFASSTSSFSGMMTVYAGISAAGGVTFANNVQAAKIEADSVYSSTTNLALFNMGIV